MAPSSFTKSDIAKDRAKKAAHQGPKKFSVVNDSYSNLTHPTRPISRGPSNYVKSSSMGQYPSLHRIAERAREYEGDNNGETFRDLFLGDMIWANAISSEFSLRDPRKKQILAPLVELIQRGIYDREDDEKRDEVEERAMRFSAVCDRYLFDFCVELKDQVRLHHPEHWDSGLMKVS